MAIESAISLQNKVDQQYGEQIKKFTNAFAVEALANAGQRLGMKGDGVRYYSFSVKDFLSETHKQQILYNTKPYNLAIKYTNGEYTQIDLQLLEAGKRYNAKSSNMNDIFDDEIDVNNIFSKYYSSKPFTFEKTINNIEKYSENSLLFVENNIFKTFLVGKRFGVADTDDFSAEIMYNEFDLESNRLIRAVRMYHLMSLNTSENESNYYTLLDIQQNDQGTNAEYLLKVYIFNDNNIDVTLDQISVIEFKNKFNYSYIQNQFKTYKDNNQNIIDIFNSYIKLNEGNTYLNYINEGSSVYQIINTYALNNDSNNLFEHLNYDYETHSILNQVNVHNYINGENLEDFITRLTNYLSQYGVEEDIYNSIGQIYSDISMYACIIKNNNTSTLSNNLKYNSESNKLVNYGDKIINDEVHNLLEQDYIGLESRINYINNDISILFPQLLEYYNQENFQSKKTIIYRLLTGLYESIYTNNLGTTANQTEYGVLYIPVDYKFNYIANSNNDIEIYFSSDLFVNLYNLDNHIQNKRYIEFILSSNSLVYDYVNEDKTEVYKFEVIYNKYYHDLINYVSVNYLYSLPYINAKYNWMINDIDTNIPAFYDYSNKLHVLFIYYSKNDNGQIVRQYLNNVDELILESSTWYDETYEYDINNNVYTVSYNLPQISEQNKEYLIDSIIFGIFDHTCIQTNSNEYSINSDLILTLLFKYVLENNKFNIITINGKPFNVAKLLNRDLIVEDISRNIVVTNEFDSIWINNRNNTILNQQNLNTFNALGVIINTSNEVLENLEQMFSDYNIQPTIQNYKQYKNNYNINLGIINAPSKSKTRYQLYNNPSDNGKYITKLDDILQPVNNLYFYLVDTEEVEEEQSIVVNTFNKKYERVIIRKNTKENYADIYSDKGVWHERIYSDNLENITPTYIDQAIIVKTKEKKEKITDKTKLQPAKEYLFDNNIPLLNFKEVFMANTNIMNRVNIISLDNEGKLYNGYVGTDFTSDNKSELVIGTSKININIGNDTLMSPTENSKFNTYDTLKLSFPTIKLDTQKTEISYPIFYSKSFMINNQNIDLYYGNIHILNSINKLNSQTPIYIDDIEKVYQQISNVIAKSSNEYDSNDVEQYIYNHYADKTNILLNELIALKPTQDQTIQPYLVNTEQQLNSIYIHSNVNNTNIFNTSNRTEILLNTIKNQTIIIATKNKQLEYTNNYYLINWVQVLKNNGIIADSYHIFINNEPIQTIDKLEDGYENVADGFDFSDKPYSYFINDYESNPTINDKLSKYFNVKSLHLTYTDTSDTSQEVILSVLNNHSNNINHNYYTISDNILDICKDIYISYYFIPNTNECNVYITDSDNIFANIYIYNKNILEEPLNQQS